MNHTLKKTVRFGLPALFAVSAALAQTSTGTTENKNDEPKTLEKFEVTGSRIKRLDFETPAPVETYTTQDMESKGYVNIGEFMQSLPFNSGTANSIFQTSSFQRGAATANIRRSYFLGLLHLTLELHETRREYRFTPHGIPLNATATAIRASRGYQSRTLYAGALYVCTATNNHGR